MQQQNAPLSEGERAELEALRAEKARREDERAQRERAELDALRAELAGEGSAAASEPIEPESFSSAASVRESHSAPEPEPSFAVRMVSTVPAEDEDGVPGMAPAQKLLIVVALLALVGFIAYMALGGS